MNVEFLNFQNMATNQNMNNGVFARFYDKAVKTGNMKKNGLPEFENKLYIEIKVRDERDVFDQPATTEHIKRFAVEYSRYLNEKKEKREGTPLELFAFLTPAQIESCHFRGVFSVESLAKMSEEQARNLCLQEEKYSIIVYFLCFDELIRSTASVFCLQVHRLSLHQAF